MKAVCKSLATGLAIVMVLCIVFVTIIMNSRQTVTANESFDGIEAIIKGSTENNPFEIAELVPDKDMAELGYMIDGQEPVNWLSDIAAIKTSDARTSFVKNLKNTLSAITANDAAKALKYTDYEESYAIPNGEGNEWSRLELASDDEIEAGTTGYSLADLGIGGGDYDDSYTYTPVAGGAGTHNENTDYFIASNSNYYNVAFEAVDSSKIVADADGKIVCTDDSLKLYYVDTRAETAIISDDILASLNGNMYLYKKSTSNMTGPFELVTDLADNPKKISSIGSYATEIEADTSNVYYAVTFTYVGDEDLNTATTYYTLKGSPEFCADKSGTYGSVNDRTHPYVAATPGNFTQTDNNCVVFVGEGMGKYNLVKGGSLSKKVIVDHTYYKGGFSNNNLFRNGVFGQDSYFTNNENSTMYFKVNTLVPAEFTLETASKQDLIYISGSSSIYGQLQSFSKINDISWNTVKSVVELVQKGKPVIVDYSILEDKISDLANDTNIKKLVALLCSNIIDSVNITDENENSTVFWETVSEALIKDADKHFVNASVYVFPGNSYDANNHQSPFLFDSFSKNLLEKTDNKNTFETRAKEAGFDEIATYINNQNLSRKTENDALGQEKYGYYDLVISKEIIIEYIICFTEMEVTELKTTIEVLDIEPCVVSDSTTDAIQANDIVNWFKGKNYNIEEVHVTHMSSGEFIGKIEDLSKYDMIYLGLSREKFKIENYNTSYNDTSMNGLIYSNVGDIVVLPSSYDTHSGLLDTDYYVNGVRERQSLIGVQPELLRNQNTLLSAANTYRFSGNDFTKEKVEDIRDYVKAGYPVIVDNRFVDNGYYGHPNNYFIDNCSNVYELTDYLVRDNSNVMTIDEAKKNPGQVYNYLMMGRPSINLEEQTKEVGTSYVKLTDDKMNFDFTISNKGSADKDSTFNLKLYLDANSDGKFSKTQEEILGSELKLYDNGEFISPEAISKDDDSSLSYEYKLLPGAKHVYRLTYSLPDGYVGIIPWKLVVSQSSNEYRYDLKTGYFYREKTEGREIINVLQINQDSTERTYKTTFDMAYRLRYNTLFRRLLNQVEDFDIKITTIPSDTYVNSYKDGYLDQYDMLIIGFADMYKIDASAEDKHIAIEAIENFINDGKPVLFTHDTTSFNNNSTNKSLWGYSFNTDIRDLVGLDRYGILSNTYLKKGKILEKYNPSTASDFENAVKTAEDNGKDVAYVPKSNKTKIVRQTQGFSTPDLYRYAYDKSNTVRAYNKVINGSNIPFNQLANWTTSKVEQVNSGQITTYPFEIPEEFVCSKTHGQYYQIDLNEDSDSDGESDIVVWYTLASYTDASINVDNSFFDYNSKDVRNNYYIYTKGNVTYSGVGHSAIDSNETELKLYINTIVAAYNSGVHSPKISIKEDETLNAKDLDTMYVSFEQSMNMDSQDDDIYKIDSESKSVEQQVQDELVNDAKEIDENANVNSIASKSVYFTVTDSNIVRNLNRKEIYVEFGVVADITETEYLADSDGYISVAIDGKQTYLKKLVVPVYQLSGDSQITYFSSGITYRADIPLNTLPAGQNSIEVYAVTNSVIVKNRKDQTESRETTGKSYDSFVIQRVGLSDLD